MAALRAVSGTGWAWCASLVIAWLPPLVSLWGTRGISHPRGLAANVDLSFVLTPAVLGVMTCLYLVCIASWTLRRRPAGSAIVAFALLALLGNVESSLYAGDSGVHHGKLLPACALLAWAVTWSLNRQKPATEREEHAYEAVLGVAAACYVLAAIAKLRRRRGVVAAGAVDRAVRRGVVVEADAALGSSALDLAPPRHRAAAGLRVRGLDAAAARGALAPAL